MNRLHYNFEAGRWAIGDRELHCGDCFRLYDENERNSIHVRIEHGGKYDCWYLIGPSGSALILTVPPRPVPSGPAAL